MMRETTMPFSIDFSLFQWEEELLKAYFLLDMKTSTDYSVSKMILESSGLLYNTWKSQYLIIHKPSINKGKAELLFSQSKRTSNSVTQWQLRSLKISKKYGTWGIDKNESVPRLPRNYELRSLDWDITSNILKQGHLINFESDSRRRLLRLYRNKR